MLNRKNTFVHISHDSRFLEKNLTLGAVAVLTSRRSLCRAFQHYSLEMRIITNKQRLSEEEKEEYHLMIAFEDLHITCKLLWIPQTIGTDSFTLDITIPKRIYGIDVTVEKQTTLLSPFKDFW